MNDTSIVGLRWWHIDQLLAIESELFGSESWTAAMFWTELAAGHVYWAALRNSLVIGYAGLAITGDEAWINNIAVTKNWQRRGIGRQLLTLLLDEAKRRSLVTVALEVAVDNTPAQVMYDSFGFEGIGVRKGYYQPSNTDALVMMKEL